ncbi:MAG: SCO family protein [Acetobacteraceae bacterium]|jgi:protein SCO1/2
MNTTTDRGPSNQTVYAIIGVLVAVLLLAAGGYLFLSGSQPAALTVGGPFSLIDGDGHPVTDQTWHGKYMLVYFGYTYCPDVCPTTMTNLADALDKMGVKADRLQPLFITVDPKRDTPAVVKQYAAAFGPRIIGLTGSAEQIAGAAKAYRVYYAEHRTGPGPDDYSMDHSSVLYLMGPDGRFIAPLRADQSGPEMAAALTKLMS